MTVFSVPISESELNSLAQKMLWSPPKETITLIDGMTPGASRTWQKARSLAYERGLEFVDPIIIIQVMLEDQYSIARGVFRRFDGLIEAALEFCRNAHSKAEKIQVLDVEKIGMTPKLKSVMDGAFAIAALNRRTEVTNEDILISILELWPCPLDPCFLSAGVLALDVREAVLEILGLPTAKDKLLFDAAKRLVKEWKMSENSKVNLRVSRGSFRGSYRASLPALPQAIFIVSFHDQNGGLSTFKRLMKLFENKKF